MTEKPFETMFPNATEYQLSQLRAMQREAPAGAELDFRALDGGNIEVTDRVSTGTGRTVVDRDGVYVEETFAPNAEGRWNRFVFDVLKSADWVRLVDLRSALYGRGTSPSAQDQNLKRLHNQGLVQLSTERSHGVTQDDNEAALTVNGKPHHLARWSGAQPR